MDPAKQQNPKPITEGKQTAGHSHSTRSKIKRTLHCDDDSSGSQAQQPPLRRQTGLVAKQTGKSVGTNNDDPDQVDSHTGDEYTSGEVALQNDLVLESVFKYVNQSDLLSCRIVTKQWQFEATKELRRRKLVIKFSFHSRRNRLSRNIVYRYICRHLKECRTPSLISSFHIKIDSEIDLGSAGPKSLFRAVGYQLKHLTLHLDYSSKNCTFKRSSLMTDLQNLLFRQAPNLQFLEIKFDFPNDWETEMERLAEFGQNPKDRNEFLQLPKLKTFIVDGTPPPKFYADVINAAVNLRSLGGAWSTLELNDFILIADGDVKFVTKHSSACIKYFLGAEGRDKIHLLKSFRAYIADGSDVEHDERDVELIKKFLTEHKKNLQLETFECVSIFFDDDSFFAPSFVEVINQILECSAGSLLKLRIEPAKWFKDLLIIPRLPKLQEICFDCEWSCREWLVDPLLGFFPRGFNMNHSFPNVSSIVLLSCDVRIFWLFVRRLEIEMTEPVPSVQHIILIDSDKTDSSVLPLASDFQRVFPNLLSISYVTSGKYYKI